MGRWNTAGWVRTTGLSYAGYVAGIVVAAVLSSRVSVTVEGVAAAAALLTAFGLLVVLPIQMTAGHPERLWAMTTALFLLFLGTPAVFLGGFFVAAKLVPGFDVRGLWGYAIVITTWYCASEALDWLAKQVAPVTAEGSQPGAPHEEPVAPHDTEGAPEWWRTPQRIPIGRGKFVGFVLLVCLCAAEGFAVGVFPRYVGVGAFLLGLSVIAVLRHNASASGSWSRWRTWSIVWIATWGALGVLSLALGWGRWLGYCALAIAFVAFERLKRERDDGSVEALDQLAPVSQGSGSDGGAESRALRR